MNSLGSMAMPETLLITKAFDQQLRALANKISNFLCRMMYIFIHRLIHSITAVQISIYYANINVFMHSVSSGLHGILVLNKIKYPIASEGLLPPDPCFRDLILRVILSVNPRSAPKCNNNLVTPVL